MLQPVRRALISVSDKSGVTELARALAARGIEILSTGGTARLLREAGLPVRDVADYTGFPEMMDGRLKTLHPKIHGGLLGRRGIDDAAMAEHQIPPIDLLVVNLYPFASAVAEPHCSYEEGIENIDIGGPAMLRGAAKNHEFVTVVVDPADYPRLLARADRAPGAHDFRTARALAASAFAHTARYDTHGGAVAHAAAPAWLRGDFPADAAAGVREGAGSALRGESASAGGVLPSRPGAAATGIAAARALQGKELSFNNIADADTAIECVRQFAQPACVIVKHANPCGVAQAATLLAAYEAAYRTDPVSAFGGIIAFNQELDAATARSIVGRQFAEVIAAPSVSAEARAVLAQQAGHPRAGGGVRGLCDAADRRSRSRAAQRRRRPAGPDPRYGAAIARAGLKVGDPSRADGAGTAGSGFRLARVQVREVQCHRVRARGATLGIGAGQMSRVYSTPPRGTEGRGREARRRRLGAGLGCILPVPRRARCRRRARHPRGHPARRLQAR